MKHIHVHIFLNTMPGKETVHELVFYMEQTVTPKDFILWPQLNMIPIF